MYCTFPFYSAICEKGFKLESRGKIDMRGIAPMETYFLVNNERATNDAIIGRPSGGQKVTHVTEKNGADVKEGMNRGYIF